MKPSRSTAEFTGDIHNGGCCCADRRASLKTYCTESGEYWIRNDGSIHLELHGQITCKETQLGVSLLLARAMRLFKKMKNTKKYFEKLLTNALLCVILLQ